MNDVKFTLTRSVNKQRELPPSIFKIKLSPAIFAAV